MTNKIKFLAALSVLVTVFGCGFFKDKVEQKVNEEIDQQIKESERKLDSIMESTNIDSIQNELDSMMKELDKTGISIDSLEKEINKKK